MRHIFLMKGSDRFPLLFFSSLKEKGTVDISKIVIFVHEEFEFQDLLNRYNISEISINPIDEIFKTNLSKTKTITLFSLRGEYFDAVNFINNKYSEKNINLMLTDDEIYKLDVIHNKFNTIVNHVDYKLVYILNSVNEFLNFKYPWGTLLEKILNKKILINNKLPLIPILPEVEQNIILENNNYKKNARYDILLGPKPSSEYGIKIVIKIVIKIFLKNRNINNKLKKNIINIKYWPSSGNNFHLKNISNIKHLLVIILLKLILFICNLLTKNQIKVSELSRMKPTEFYKMLITCDLLFSKNRGGGSTIREFIKSGGCVVFKHDSYNHKVYKKNISNKVVTFKNKKYIADIIIDYINNKNTYQQIYNESKLKLYRQEVCSVKYYTRYFS